MLPRLRRWAFLFAIFTGPGLAAALPCVTDTLFNYEGLGATGCTIGALTVKNFVYNSLPGNTVAIPDTAITVTPTVGANTLDLNFLSNSFATVTSTDTAKYLLAYTWDPGDIRSLDDILNANSPVFPGFAQISTLACLDAAFSGSSCGKSTASVVVNDDGHTLNSPASVAFSPTIGTLGIRNTIELDANGASSEIKSFDNQIALPEPSTVIPCLFLSVLLFRRSRGVHVRG